MKIKVSQEDSKEGDNVKNYSQKTLQTKKSIYNKALQMFIEEKIGHDIHFGNMNNNLTEVLKRLEIGHLMESKVKLPQIDVARLNMVNVKSNEFSDFDPHEIFTCTFYAKEGVNTEDFNKGIKVFEEKFLKVYHPSIIKNIESLEQEIKIDNRKKEKKDILMFIIIAIIAIIVIYFLTENQMLFAR